MRKISLFMLVSLDGYFEGKNHDLSWHNVDEEFNDTFIIPQTKTISTILFGRRTYEMMADFWQSDEAKRTDPITSKLMNDTQKLVFSTTLKQANWNNTNLVSEGVFEKVKALKQQEGGLIAIFGSNNLMVSLSEENLIDEFRILINPIVLGSGTPLFFGLKNKLKLKLLRSEEFKNGNVLLTYNKKA